MLALTLAAAALAPAATTAAQEEPPPGITTSAEAIVSAPQDITRFSFSVAGARSAAARP